MPRLESRLVRLGELSWRDRIQLLNSALFCVIGAALVARYALGSAPSVLAILGGVFLAFGVYRLALARGELRKRARSGK
jgi:hypothetical protein